MFLRSCLSISNEQSSFVPAMDGDQYPHDDGMNLSSQVYGVVMFCTYNKKVLLETTAWLPFDCLLFLWDWWKLSHRGSGLLHLFYLLLRHHSLKFILIASSSRSLTWRILLYDAHDIPCLIVLLVELLQNIVHHILVLVSVNSEPESPRGPTTTSCSATPAVSPAVAFDGRDGALGSESARRRANAAGSACGFWISSVCYSEPASCASPSSATEPPLLFTLPHPLAYGSYPPWSEVEIPVRASTSHLSWLPRRPFRDTAAAVRLLSRSPWFCQEGMQKNEKGLWSSSIVDRVPAQFVNTPLFS